MISFDQQNTRFKYRVAGLAVNDGYVLLTKADQDEYWILPGGRVELGEDTRTALQREILEETGQRARIGNLLWIVENFFDLDGTDYHELAFVYAISPTDTAILENTRDPPDHGRRSQHRTPLVRPRPPRRRPLPTCLLRGRTASPSQNNAARNRQGTERDTELSAESREAAG